MQNSNDCKLRVVKVNFRGVEHVAYLVYMTSEELAYLKDFFDKYKSSYEFTMPISKDLKEFGDYHELLERAQNGELGNLNSVITDLCSVKFSIPETVTKFNKHAELVLKELGFQTWEGDIIAGTFFVRTKNLDEATDVFRILQGCICSSDFSLKDVHVAKDSIWVYDNVFAYTETVMKEYEYINHKKLDEFKESMRLHKVAGFL